MAEGETLAYFDIILLYHYKKKGGQPNKKIYMKTGWMHLFEN